MRSKSTSKFVNFHQPPKRRPAWMAGYDLRSLKLFPYGEVLDPLQLLRLGMGSTIFAITVDCFKRKFRWLASVIQFTMFMNCWAIEWQNGKYLRNVFIEICQLIGCHKIQSTWIANLSDVVKTESLLENLFTHSNSLSHGYLIKYLPKTFKLVYIQIKHGTGSTGLIFPCGYFVKSLSYCNDIQ